jgi:hypothetical protein
MNQLQERQRELKTTSLHLEGERTVLEHKIAQHHDEVRAWAHDAHRRIIEDDDGLPRFAWASQNIAAMAALLQRLQEPTTPEGRQAQGEIRVLLECMAVQQAESSVSQ